jgi:hypothetical protein
MTSPARCHQLQDKLYHRTENPFIRRLCPRTVHRVCACVVARVLMSRATFDSMSRSFNSHVASAFAFETQCAVRALELEPPRREGRALPVSSFAELWLPTPDYVVDWCIDFDALPVTVVHGRAATGSSDASRCSATSSRTNGKKKIKESIDLL